MAKIFSPFLDEADPKAIKLTLIRGRARKNDPSATFSLSPGNKQMNPPERLVVQPVIASGSGGIWFDAERLVHCKA